MALLDLSEEELDQSFAIGDAMYEHIAKQDCKVALAANLSVLHTILSITHGDELSEDAMDHIEHYLEGLSRREQEYDQPMPYGRKKRKAKA